MTDLTAPSEFLTLCHAAAIEPSEAASYFGLTPHEMDQLRDCKKLPARLRQAFLVETKYGRREAAPAPGKPKSVHAPSVRTAISLFSGGGGLDLGVEAAGFRTLACVEKDVNCCDTLTNNQPNFFAHATVINGSVDDVDLTGLMTEKGLREGDLDLLFGGPPCQTFSQIGKLGGINDARGLLLFSMVDYARILRPKAILIENVKALLSAKDISGERGGVVRQLKANLRQLGYNCAHKIINSADFGIAQKRERLFIVALLGEREFEFPPNSVEPEQYLTVGDAIAGLPIPAKKGAIPQVSNHIDVTPAGDRKRISYVPEGTFLAKVADAPADIKGRLSPKDTTKFLRLGRKKLSNTLRCGEIFFHPTEDRYLTPRECMRLHGFPDEYHLSGPIRGRSGSVRNLDQHRQIANSVPPPVAEAIARAIVTQMEGVSDGRSRCRG